MRVLVLVSVLALSPLVSFADTLMTLDDVEGTFASWSKMQPVTSPVHSGGHALEWDVAAAPICDSPRFSADWREFDELRFWAYLKTPVNLSVPIVFVAPGGYYMAQWRLDWTGWKEQRIKLSDCSKAHEPAGWDQIQSFGFRAQGYGQPPVPAGLTVVLDDFTLHSPKDLPHKTLQDWIVQERKQRMQQLKESGNPYFQTVIESLKSVKATPDLPENPTSAWSYRGVCARLLPVAWAAASDQSPRKGDPTLIANALAVIDYCLANQKEGSWYYTRKWEQTSDPNADRFALGPLMDAVWFLRQLPEGKEAWKRWDAPLRQLADFQYEKWWRYAEHGYTDNVAWGSSARIYPNQDVFVLYIMAVAYELWGDPKYQEAAHGTLAALDKALLPDGGFHYIGPETECDTYHTLNLVWIGRYYQLTHDEKARELLAKTVNYYPLSYTAEARPEYYTDCWWKHYWADASPNGPEIVAGVTGDGQNKYLADRAMERKGIGSDDAAVYTGMFYRGDVEARKPADNWLKLDRNIGGPRGAFGTWHFAGTVGGGARDTFVGGMVSDPQRSQPLYGAFLAANIEVALGGSGARDRTHLFLSGPDDQTSVAVAGDASILAARYSPRKGYINGIFNPQVAPTPWQATQVWLLSRWGLLGLVELEAKEAQTVPYLGGELRFGPELALTAEGDGFRCGDLTARVLEHNFATLETMPARPGYAQQRTANSMLYLRTAGDSYAAKPGEPLRYVAWIAPAGAPTVEDFSRLQVPGVWGFRARIAGRPLAAVYNPAGTPVTVSITWPTTSATIYRGDGTSAALKIERAADGSLSLSVPAQTALLVDTE
ncbi:hypothetical protein LLH03_15190 [bacterium]|nr:hypothetical protein [bacterium]